MLRPIAPGAVLRVIAPSGPFDPEAFDAGLEWLRKRYEVRVRDDVKARTGFLAGDDRRRLAELEEACADEDAVAILCARGGYGATRLLPSLDPRDVPQKLLIGFSDVTALHALWSRAGVPSVHAPMLAWLGRADDETRRTWTASLEDTRCVVQGRPLVPGAVRAPIVGGNLAVLAALGGTPHAPPLDGRILFLEEVGEAPYRIDRMLTQLRQAGWFDELAGVCVGELVRCEGKHGVTAAEVVRAHLSDLELPVITDLPVGHGHPNEALYLNVPARLRADGTLAFGGAAEVP